MWWKGQVSRRFKFASFVWLNLTTQSDNHARYAVAEFFSYKLLSALQFLIRSTFAGRRRRCNNRGFIASPLFAKLSPGFREKSARSPNDRHRPNDFAPRYYPKWPLFYPWSIKDREKSCRGYISQGLPKTGAHLRLSRRLIKYIAPRSLCVQIIYWNWRGEKVGLIPKIT